MHIVIDPGTTDLKKYQVLDEKDYDEYRLMYEDDFRAGDVYKRQAEQTLELGRIVYGGDYEYFAYAREHERRQRIVYHRLVIYGQ